MAERVAGQLQRIRVVVATRDGEFCSSASELLTDQGFLVETTDKSSRVPELIGRTRADVVVVDGCQSPRAVAHVIAVMAAIARPIGLLVVADDDAPDWVARLSPLRKRDLAETLAPAVERAFNASSEVRSAVAAVH
jgi:AmiR/NasT family two-component response regulator